MSYWQELGKFLISTSVFGGLIIWLLKTYFENQLKNDIEKHKAELELFNYKQKTQFTKLHEETAETIKKIYALLARYSSSINTAVGLLENPYDIDFQQIGNQLDEILKTGIELQNFYEENKILLKDEVCKKIEQVDAILFGSTKKVMISQALRNNLNDKNKPQLLETLTELKRLLQIDLPPLKEELEKEFRSILGVIS